jgi:hypothetical protein
MNHRWDEELRRRRAAEVERERYGAREIDDAEVRRRDRAALERPMRNASPWEIGAAHWDQRDLYTKNPRTDDEGYGRGPSLHPEEGSLAYRRHALREPTNVPQNDFDTYYEREAWPWLHYQDAPWRHARGGFFHRMRERIFGKHTGKGPKNWSPSPAQIRDEICASFAYHGDLDATDIDVTVEGTEVTLEGTVPDKRQKRLAEDLAHHCMNVSDVHNRLKVRPHDDPTDADVAFVAPLRAM